MARFREIEFHDQFDIIVAIANGGIIPAAILNQRLGVEFQILKINLRDTNQKPKYENPQLLSPVGFEYRDKTILMVEDRIKRVLPSILQSDFCRVPKKLRHLRLMEMPIMHYTTNLVFDFPGISKN